MGKVMRHTLGASLNIRHNLSSSKGPKPLQLKLLTTYIPKTSALRLPLVPRNGCGRPGRAPERFLPLDITSRSEERFSRNAETDLVCRLLLEKKKNKTRGKRYRRTKRARRTFRRKRGYDTSWSGPR